MSHVAVRLGDPLKQLKKLVDTGATHPCIPKKLADELGLEENLAVSASLLKIPRIKFESCKRGR